MKRRTRLNLALGALVALAGAFIAIGPGSGKTPAQATLVPAPPADVSTIGITRSDGTSMSFRREGNHWFMQSPFHAPANSRRMVDLLAVPALPSAATLDIRPAEWASFGLAPAAAALRLDDRLIEFGTTEALDGMRYVRTGNRVHLVAERVFVQLLQGPAFFIDPHLLRAGSRPVRIGTPLRVIELRDGDWRSVSGPVTPAATNMAGSWLSAEATSVHTGVDEHTGPAVTVALDGGSAIVFEFVDRDGLLELRRRDLDLRYALDPDLARELGLLEPVAATAPAVPAAH